ncbi:hypothetical protein [Mariniradius sediminis]|uniref:Uncharacterized protein n=1 Tax=Mariniradius sediminis TaxID=2909237 RepID=A0ABS9BUN3_9BACT|nr:hypothetical protein [Mariniradius sediminis]MCF1751336.1 hypothetical protein [Mariniradius sediminis]
MSPGFDKNAGLLLGETNSKMSIQGKLLVSKPTTVPSEVIFKVKISVRDTKIYFKSTDVRVFLTGRELNSVKEIGLATNNLHTTHLPQNREIEFKVFASIPKSEVNDFKQVDKISLRLPPILAGDEELDFGDIEFELR